MTNNKTKSIKPRIKKTKVPADKNKGKIFCDVNKCLACHTCELACVVEHSLSKNLFSAIMEEKLAQKKRDVEYLTPEKTLSISCQNCQEPLCVAACMSGAMHKDKSNKVVYDLEQCVGCWMCLMVCPYASITRNVFNKKANKCDFCPDRDDYACVISCPTRALTVKEK